MNYSWLDTPAAGERHGVVVFPDVEVTTASGADGARLILIGDLDRTVRDIDTLLALSDSEQAVGGEGRAGCG